MIPMFNLYTSIGWYDSWSPIIVPAFLETPRSRSCLCSISERSPFHLTRPKSTGHLTFMCFAQGAGAYVHAGHHDHGDLCIPRAWNQYLEPLLYIIDPSKWTLSLAMATYTGTYATAWNLFMAADLIYILPMLLLLLWPEVFMQGWAP